MKPEEKNIFKKEIFDLLVLGDLNTAKGNSSANEISFNEVNEIAEDAFRHLLKINKISIALDVFNSYKIPTDSLINEIRIKFNLLFQKKVYIDAFLIGKALNLSNKRSITAGIRGLRQLLSENNVNKIIELENEHGILHDEDIIDIDEQDVKSFIQIFNEEILTKYLEQNKIDQLYEIVDSLGIYNDYVQNPLLSELVLLITSTLVKTHSQILNDGRGPIAFEVTKNFRLLEIDTPEDIKSKVIEDAVNTHQRLISENNLKFLVTSNAIGPLPSFRI